MKRETKTLCKLCKNKISVDYIHTMSTFSDKTGHYENCLFLDRRAVNVVSPNIYTNDPNTFEYVITYCNQYVKVSKEKEKQIIEKEKKEEKQRAEAKLKTNIYRNLEKAQTAVDIIEKSGFTHGFQDEDRTYTNTERSLDQRLDCAVMAQ